MRLGGEDTARRYAGVDKVYSSILDDVFTIFHWVFLPGIITLIMYSELDDNAERWVAEFEKDGKKAPNDLPAGETLLTFSLVSLIMHGVSAYMLWRRCGGIRKNYISLVIWELSVAFYFLAFGLFLDVSEVTGVASILISGGLTVLNFIYFLQAERKGSFLQIPFIGWLIFLNYCGLRVLGVDEPAS